MSKHSPTPLIHLDVLRQAQDETSVSFGLLEDAEDISAHRLRAAEQNLAFADVVLALQQCEKL